MPPQLFAEDEGVDTAPADDQQPDNSDVMADGPEPVAPEATTDTPSPDEQAGTDTAAPAAEDQPQEDEPPLNEEQDSTLPPKKESKVLETLDAIYNPERWENDRSLWTLWQQELKEFPTVDELARDREKKGCKVDMEIIHYEWFDSLISVYRRFLQQAFGYSLELPVLGRRLQRFQESNRNMVHWRYAWIRRYKEEQEIAAQQRQQTCEQPTADDRRRAALARRQAKLSGHQTNLEPQPQQDCPPDDARDQPTAMFDENAAFFHEDEENVPTITTQEERKKADLEARRREALLRREKKRSAAK